MKKSDNIQRQMAALAAAYDEALQQEREAQSRYGEEPERNGAVITWRMRFHKGGLKYHYAAIKAKGLWYTTGPNSPKGCDRVHERHGLESQADGRRWSGDLRPVGCTRLAGQTTCRQRR